MRIAWLIILLCLIGGCLLGDDSDLSDPIPEESPAEPAPGDGDMGLAPGGPHWTGCGIQVFELEGPDGEVFTIELPIECNPYWHDGPDPAPDVQDPVDEVTMEEIWEQEAL